MFENASDSSVVFVFGIVACPKLGATSREIEPHLGMSCEKQRK